MIIAVADSGGEASSSFMQKTSNGQPKIVDQICVSGCGDVPVTVCTAKMDENNR